MKQGKPVALAARLRALDEAAGLCRGRSSSEAVSTAESVVRRAGERIAFSGGHTVVALAGATGSGKSSTFNALTGTSLAEVGVRRPTTARAMATTWGSSLPHELLDWLDVSSRHLIADGGGAFSDLVLLDLPDHDSTEVDHRMTVDRLVQLVDALIWVVDPQKYADAALHETYLKPMAPYAPVMMVVLNQADRLAPADLRQCLADLRRLLDSEGLAATPILPISATLGTGVPELRDMLARVVAQKRAMARRLAADVTVAAAGLAAELGEADPPRLGPAVIDGLTGSLAEGAGVPIVVEGVQRAWRLRGGAATGWPFVTWLSRLKPDPLRRLRMNLRPEDHSPTGVNRTSLPPANAVQRARVERGLRELSEVATEGLPRGWAQAVRGAARDNESLLLDRLDTAIARADLRVDDGSWWWLFRALQWLLMLGVLVGAAWLVAVPLLAFLQLPPLPEVLWYQVPAALWLVGGGVLAGLLLAGLGRVFVAFGARRKGRVAERILHAIVDEVADAEVIAPVRAELDRYAAARDAVRRAMG